LECFCAGAKYVKSSTQKVTFGVQQLFCGSMSGRYRIIGTGGLALRWDCSVLPFAIVL